MNIPFSPPDITEQEIQEVAEALRSGWITTGPRTKELERQVATYCGVNRAVCLNSQTACAEMALRVLGIGPGDEVITTAYTYTAATFEADTYFWILQFYGPTADLQENQPEIDIILESLRKKA